MKQYILIMFLGSLLASCSLGRYNQESINLKPQEDKYHVQGKLVKIQRTMRGFKHTFAYNKADTLFRTYPKPLKNIPPDSCYSIWKTKLDK